MNPFKPQQKKTKTVKKKTKCPKAGTKKCSCSKKHK